MKRYSKQFKWHGWMSATNKLVVIIDNEQAMGELAATIAGYIKQPSVIALSGDLGVGKTVFARALIHALCDTTEAVISPTFMLQQTYQMRLGQRLHHFDFYRIKHAEELAELGFEEALTNDICMIEWPDIASSLLPDETLYLAIEHHGDQQHRSVTLTSEQSYWMDVLHHLDQRKRAS
jgi:tRNA threonylcarbamoyl adenosine modification protein YjeE